MRIERLKESLIVTSFWILASAVSLIILAVFALYAETPMDGYRKAGRWNATLTVTDRTLPEASGLEPGDRIVAIDGKRLNQREIEKPIKLIAYLKTPGKSALYEIERNGQAMTVEVPLHKMGWGRMLAIGGIHPLLALFYVITASILFLHSGHSRKSDSSTFYHSRSLRVIAYALVFGAAGIVLGADMSVRSGAEWLGLLMTPGPITSGFAFGLMLHFLLTFPPRDNLFTRSRWAVYALHGSYLSLAIASIIFFLRVKSVPWTLSQTRFSMQAVFILSSATAAFLSYKRATCPVKKNQMKSLAWGVSLGIGPWFFVYLIPTLAGSRPFIDHRVVLLFLSFIPISLLIAISRYKLLEIDKLIRRSLVYTFAMASMTGAYLIAFASVTRFIEIRAGISDPVTPAVLSALLLAFAFNPLRVMSERLVEKLFYRGSVNPREAFSKLSLEINQVIKLPQLIEVLTVSLPRAFALSGASLIILDKDDRWQAYASSEELYRSVNEDAEQLVNHIKSNQSLWPTTIYPVTDQGDDKKIAMPKGVALCFPMSVAGRLTGIFLLGEKRSGRLFSKDELDALRTLAHHAATTLDNACTYQRLNDMNAELENLIELRTQQLQEANLEMGHRNTELIKQNAELARLLRELRETQAALVEAERRAAIGEIVITVCHEINNPLSAIIGQAQLIQLSPEGVPDRIMEKVNIIDQCGERIREITDKMRQLKTAKTVIYAGQEKMIDIHQDEATQ